MNHERKIVLIRHGQTQMNKEDRIRGWKNVPLDTKGFEQAQQVGRELKGNGIDYLVSSDLTRALQTTQQISLESGIPLVAVSSAFRPLDVGTFTGELAEKVHPVIMQLSLEAPEDPVGGGESFDTFRYRVLMGLISFLNEYDDCLLGIVCHHRNDRLIRGWVEAGCPDDFSIDMDHFFQKGIPTGSWDVLELESDLLV